MAEPLPTIPETGPLVQPLGSTQKTGKRKKPLAKRTRDRVLVVLSLIIIFRWLCQERIPVVGQMQDWYRLTRLMVTLGIYSVGKADKAGRTLLHRSARAGNTRLCEFLIARNANASAQDELGRTPLHEAAAALSEGCIRVLIASGASSSARTNSGITPLHRSVASLWLGSYEAAVLPTIKLLVAEGADPLAADAAGRSPFAHLFDRPPGLLFTERELMRKGIAAERIVSQFRAWGVNVTAPLSLAGHTALHLAAAWAPGSLVWDLIDAGASPTAPLTAESGWGSGLRGATPLHIAAQNGNLAMASALIAAGANVDAADKNGMTPLHFVTDALNKGARGPAPFARDGERTERLLGMLEFLCEAGANPLRRSKEGLIPSVYLTLLRPKIAAADEPPPVQNGLASALGPFRAMFGGGRRRRLSPRVIKKAKRILEETAAAYQAGGVASRAGGGGGKKGQEEQGGGGATLGGEKAATREVEL